MKVLVACEYSGTVRDAFIRHGHDSISCDLLPTESPGPHYQGDVMDIINDRWDMMIAHPPCTYLSYAGTRHWNAPGRCKKRLQALEFFRILWEAPIDKICIENPKGCASPTIAKYTQEIQPYYFGDEEMKTTWLWLKNIPPLEYNFDDGLFHKRSTTDKPKPIKCRPVAGRMKNYFYTEKTRSPHERARFWPGIAEAMATQWSNL